MGDPSEVVNDVVHHERGRAGLEVFGAVGENAPDCHLLFFRIVFFTPRQHDTITAIHEAEMLCVPLLRLLLIRGLEEDPADADDSALLAHGCFPRLGLYRGSAHSDPTLQACGSFPTWRPD